MGVTMFLQELLCNVKSYYILALFLFKIIKLSVIFEVKSDFYNVLKL